VVEWSNTSTINYGRYYHTASVLTNGNVLVTGGQGLASICLNSAELYDPSTGAWAVTGNMTYGRRFHTASMLTHGNVLVTGGQSLSGPYVNSAELYDPSTGVWSITGNMTYARRYHTASVLTNGSVLVTSGQGSSGYLLVLNCMIHQQEYGQSLGIWLMVDFITQHLC
jgi:N-acetylneuraminic acid mutarotase